MSRRAAIDCGSGMLRLLAIDSDANVVISRIASVPFAHALATNDQFATLPDWIIDRGVLQVRQFVDESKQLGVQRVFMVCTAVFRRALNASLFVQRVLSECPAVAVCRIISQSDESKMGYLTAVAASHSAPRPVVSLDVGGASFQIASPDDSNDAVGQLNVFAGPHGSVTSLSALADLRGTTVVAAPSPNPVAFDEVAPLALKLAALFPERPQWLVDALRGSIPLVAIGDATSVFAVVANHVGHTDLTRADVLRTLEGMCGLTDAEMVARNIVQPEVCVPKLTLLLAIFDHLLGADASVRYCETTGSCLGILEYFTQHEKVTIAADPAEAQ